MSLSTQDSPASDTIVLLGHHERVVAIAWAMFGLMAAALGVLASGLFSLPSRIDAQGDALSARIDAQSARIDAQGAALGARIDDLTKTMHEGFRDLDRRLTATGA